MLHSTKAQYWKICRVATNTVLSAYANEDFAHQVLDLPVPLHLARSEVVFFGELLLFFFFVFSTTVLAQTSLEIPLRLWTLMDTLVLLMALPRGLPRGLPALDLRAGFPGL